MDRTRPLERRTPLRRKKRLSPVNRKRKEREFARAYGSVERVRRMRMRACDGCGRVATERRPNDCHHLEGDGGASMKSGWRFTVTLCRACHDFWHDLGSTRDFDASEGTDLHETARRLAVEIGQHG